MSHLFESKITHKGEKYILRQLSFKESQKFNEYLLKTELSPAFQSYQWGELKKSHGWQPIRLFLERNNTVVAATSILKRTDAGLTFFYSPRGPVLDYSNEVDLLGIICKGLVPLAEAHKAVFWRVDPEIPTVLKSKFIEHSFKEVPMDNDFGGIQPKWVWRIPLTMDREKQWESLTKGARRQIKKATKLNIRIVDGSSKDLSVFYKLLQETANYQGFLLRDKSYYLTMWSKLSSLDLKMLLAYHRNEPVSTAIVIGFGKGIWDIYAGNSSNHRDLGASYLLTWELIAWAGEQGYKFYDLGGIASRVDKDHPLDGLRVFKSRFGGEEVEFVGEMDLVFNAALYKAWTIGKKAFSLKNDLRKKLSL